MRRAGAAEGVHHILKLESIYCSRSLCCRTQAPFAMKVTGLSGNGLTLASG